MNKSKLFTACEHDALMKRFEGSLKDDTGIISARVKPKIRELLDVWFPLKKKLEKVVEVKHGEK